MPEIVVGVSLEKMIFFSAWIYVFLIGFWAKNSPVTPIWE